MINHPAGSPAQPVLDRGPDDGTDGAAAAPRPGRPHTRLATRRRSRPRARPSVARPAVLLAAFVCAACGLVYELELVALGSHLIGDSVTQTSVVLSVMVFAMGLGSLLAKRFTRRPATAFALVECALALVGGLSVLTLYACWAWLGGYQAALVGLTGVIGVLIGAEIPLLMTLIQRIRREDAGRAVADLFAADYVGALVGGLAFPFLILPAFGQATGALVTGAVNAVAGAGVVLWLFRDEPAPRLRVLLWAACGLVLVTLGAAAAFSGAIERAARHALYGAQIRFAAQSRYQEIVLTGPDDGAATDARQPLRLFLDGRSAVCGPDQYRADEALVHPAMAGPDARVLLFGGGDGLALREVLRHSGVRSVRLVELDPALTALARSDPALAALGGHSLDDPRVRITHADALEWLRDRAAGRPEGPDDGPFDVVISGLPAPPEAGTGTFQSEEFFGLALRVLAPGGRIAVRAGGAESGLWPVEAGLRAAALQTLPYGLPAGPATVCGPARRQSFVLAAAAPPRPALADDAPPPRALTTEGLRDSADRLAAARPARSPAALTLLGPR